MLDTPEKPKLEAKEWTPSTKAEERMEERYRGWSVQRRMKMAITMAVNGRDTISALARVYGVSRGQLSSRVNEKRRTMEAQEFRGRNEGIADAVIQQASSPVGLYEKRRVPSFAEFDEKYFGHWQCPDCQKHHETPPFHYEIQEALSDPEIKRLVVNVFPFGAKSTVATVKSTLYDIVCNPNSRTIVVSKAQELAKDFISQMEMLLSDPEQYRPGHSLIDDWGPFVEGAREWNKTRFIVAGRQSPEKDPTVQALGVGGQIYGKRADVIKFDDIADFHNQRNPDSVTNMMTWIDRNALNRVGYNKGKALWVGTRVAAGDIYSVLRSRPGYRVIEYPLIPSEAEQTTLWPDHISWERALEIRASLSIPDWQLVFQQADDPGQGASFTYEMIEPCLDRQRTIGHIGSGWKVVAGLDPAGAGKWAGFTAMIVKGIDPVTHRRHLIDAVNVRSMKAPQMKAKMFELTDMYPISEWRVEVNAFASQLLQYDEELNAQMANRGVRVVPHITGKNKWDGTFGVEAMAPLFINRLVSIPWMTERDRDTFRPLVDQLCAFPMTETFDLVMADWFSELAAKDYTRRQQVPLFDRRQRMPSWVKARRRVFDPNGQTFDKVPVHQQEGHQFYGAPSGPRRVVEGTFTKNENMKWEEEKPAERKFVNVGA